MTKLIKNETKYTRLLLIVLSLILVVSLAFATACPSSATTATPESPNLTAADIYRRHATSIVQINVGTQVGTGFIVRQILSRWYIATNFHVLQEAIEGSVSLDGDSFIFNSRLSVENSHLQTFDIIAYDIYFDIAIARVNYVESFHTSMIQFMPTTTTTPNGTQLTALGNMDGHGISVFNGIMSNNNRVVSLGESEPHSTRYRPLYQTTISLNPGMSGGPVFCNRGYFVGISTFRRLLDSSGNPVQGVSYLVPASIAMPLINHAIAGQIQGAMAHTHPRLNSLYSLTILALGGLTIARESGGLFYVLHTGTRPIGVESWFTRGETVHSVGSLRLTNSTTWKQIIAELSRFIHGTGGGNLLRMEVGDNARIITIRNFTN